MRLFFLSLFSLILVACGGAGQESDRIGYTPEPSKPTLGSGFVTTFITDNLTQDYSEVWVVIDEISVVDSSGNLIELYKDTSGKSVNLSQLVTVSQLLGKASVTEGTYTEFVVKLENKITLVDNINNTINATLAADGTDVQIKVTGNLVVSANATSDLTLDFDLASFTYNADTNVVDASVVVFDNTQTRTQHAELRGTVESVGADSFVVSSARFAENITVNQTSYTEVYDETSANTGDFSLVAVGDIVEVSGEFDSNNTAIAASRVRIESETTIDGSNDSLDKVEGSVVSFDGSTLVLDIRNASFVPGSDTLSIANITNANYETGALEQLAAGQWIEVSGTWDGTNFTANYIHIEGALTDVERSEGNYVADYVEVEGIIQSVNGSELTISVSKSEHSSTITVNSDLMVDITNSYLQGGDSSCLVAGSYIEAKGALSDVGLVAKKVEFKGECGSFSDYQNHDDSGTDNSTDSDNSSDSDNSTDSDTESNDNSNDDGVNHNDNYVDNDQDGFDDNYDDSYHEVKGIITNVTSTSITLRISKTEGFTTSASEIVIDITNTVFKDGTASDLIVNTFVEVKGYWDGVSFTSRKVEFD